MTARGGIAGQAVTAQSRFRRSLRRVASRSWWLYKTGNRALERGDLSLAIERINKACSMVPERASWLQRLGFVKERDGRTEEALEDYEKAINIDPGHAEWFYRSAVCKRKLSRYDEAAADLEIAIALDPNHARARKALVGVAAFIGTDWRRCGLLEAAGRGSRDAEAHLAYCRALFSMRRYLAVINSRDIDRLEGDDRKAACIILARSHLQLENVAEAYDLLSDISGSKESPAKYIEDVGDWRGAEKLYRHAWKSGIRDAGTAFGLAFSLDRQYMWKEANKWYPRAITMASGKKPYWNYKYGHSLERLGEYDLAASAYSYALHIGGNKQKDWKFRLGTCLYELGQYEAALVPLEDWCGPSAHVPHSAALEASDMVLRSFAHRSHLYLAQDDLRQRPIMELALARECRALGDYEGAMDHYLKCARSSAEVDLSVSREISDFMASQYQYKEACELLLSSREFRRPDGIPLKNLIKSKYQRRRFRYVEYREREAVDHDVVLFESFWGKKISDNPLAIYLEMRSDPRFSHCRFYWTVTESTTIPSALNGDDRTFVVPYGSSLYERLLATAGVLINNTSFVEYFARRDGQEYINTWHGTPLKTLGKRIGTGVLEHANVTHNFLNCTLLYLPNEHTAHSIVRDYDLEGLYSGEIIVGGSPRLDRLVSTRKNGRQDLLSSLGIDDRGEQIVFYAPTWRGSADERSMDVEGAQSAIRAMASVSNVILLFRSHHLAESAIGEVEGAVIVPSEIDTYDVLRGADVLVTDYSSLLFDYLSTGRRVISYAPDISEYEAERGLYLLPSDVISDAVTTVDELKRLLGDRGFEPDKRYLESRNIYCGMEDGGASVRVLDWIQGRWAKTESTVTAADSRRTLVFAESLVPNGIRSSMFNLFSNLGGSKYRIYVALNAVDIAHDESRAAAVRSLNKNYGFLGRNGQMLVSLEEAWVLSHYSANFGAISEPLRNYVRVAYRREFRRVFGAPRDVTFIDFEGYSRFWNALFAYGPPPGNSNMVVLHNQIRREIDVRLPYLAEIARMYEDFDVVASVADAIFDENAELARSMNPRHDARMTVVHNSLNIDKIREEAASGESLWDAVPSDGPRIVTVGRLSPEKNHELLLLSMSVLHARLPGAHLMIVGSGPMEMRLKALSASLGVSDYVHFSGFVSEPAATIAASDLFVMPSLHEGQPMVIFEAMTLGIPVLTSPVPGSAEAVAMGTGEVVATDPEVFAEAMERWVNRSSALSFDADDYNRRAVQEFQSAIRQVDK